MAVSYKKLFHLLIETLIVKKTSEGNGNIISNEGPAAVINIG